MPKIAHITLTIPVSYEDEDAGYPDSQLSDSAFKEILYVLKHGVEETGCWSVMFDRAIEGAAHIEEVPD